MSTTDRPGRNDDRAFSFSILNNRSAASDSASQHQPSVAIPSNTRRTTSWPMNPRELMACPPCNNALWICEAHPERPWPHDDCPGAGRALPALQHRRAAADAAWLCEPPSRQREATVSEERLFSSTRRSLNANIASMASLRRKRSTTRLSTMSGSSPVPPWKT